MGLVARHMRVDVCVCVCGAKCFPFQPFRNIIHGSDSVESAKHEISLWFKDDEVSSYTSCAQSWLYGN